MPAIAEIPEPPYYAVIFIANPSENQSDYEATVGRMAELASQMPGFLGLEFAHASGEGGEVVVSYWRDEASIAGWKRDAEHQIAQRRGREQWYRNYMIRVAKVERHYGFSA